MVGHMIEATHGLLHVFVDEVEFGLEFTPSIHQLTCSGMSLLQYPECTDLVWPLQNPVSIILVALCTTSANHHLGSRTLNLWSNK